MTGVRVLRILPAALLWLCGHVSRTAGPEVDRLRPALEVGLLSRQGPMAWIAARDWGPRLHLLDPTPGQRQRGRSDCGPTSLRRALRLQGIPERTLPPLRVGADGSSLQDLHDATHRAGLQARVVRVTDLRNLTLPAILHLRRRHYVVLEERRGGTMFLFDPVHGRLSLPVAALVTRLSGAALQFEPASRTPPSVAPGHAATGPAAGLATCSGTAP